MCDMGTAFISIDAPAGYYVINCTEHKSLYETTKFGMKYAVVRKYYEDEEDHYKDICYSDKKKELDLVCELLNENMDKVTQ